MFANEIIKKCKKIKRKEQVSIRVKCVKRGEYLPIHKEEKGGHNEQQQNRTRHAQLNAEKTNQNLIVASSPHKLS